MIKIKKLGCSKYYLSDNHKYFVKQNKENKHLLKKEFLNLKKFKKNVSINKLKCITPIKFDLSKGQLFTEYIDADPLILNLKPKLYFEFGKVLKKFHNKGFSQGHLQFNDVLFFKGEFYLTDLPKFNERKTIHDLILLNNSIKLFKIKRFWNYYKYDKCFKSFIEGYGLKDLKKIKKAAKKDISKKIEKLISNRNALKKLKGIFLKIFYKLIWLN